MPRLLVRDALACALYHVSEHSDLSPSNFNKEEDGDETANDPNLISDGFLTKIYVTLHIYRPSSTNKLIIEEVYSMG